MTREGGIGQNLIFPDFGLFDFNKCFTHDFVWQFGFEGQTKGAFPPLKSGRFVSLSVQGPFGAYEVTL